MKRNRFVWDRGAGRPPFFCAAGTAGRAFARAFGAVLITSALAAGAVLVGVADRPAMDPFGATAGAVHLPEDPAALPGIVVTGPGLSDATGPDGSGASGPLRRARVRTFAFGATATFAVDAVRTRGLERQQLGLAIALLRAQLGFSSFHCDTPPPAQG